LLHIIKAYQEARWAPRLLARIAKQLGLWFLANPGYLTAFDPEPPLRGTFLTFDLYPTLRPSAQSICRRKTKVRLFVTTESPT
jgi:hypothetical protein